MNHHNFILRWENLVVEVENNEGSFFRSKFIAKEILKNVSGSAMSNSLIAIMGSSGAGKSTLLRTLTGRIQAKCGIIMLNEKNVSPKVIRSISGYLQQEDIFLETLTVYEHMLFMAAMKMERTSEERIITIIKLLKDLNLTECKNTLIKYISGGQKRRLSLATELIDDPYILFCDEPTTGLDSFSAISVIQKLRGSASRGRIVLITIHQPSSQLFDLFDNIILLANGTLVVQGSKEEVKEFFESEDLVCPLLYNPPDFYIKCLSQNGILNGLHNKSQFKNYPYFDDITRSLYTIQTNKNERYFQKGFLFELYWLMWRMNLDYRRNLHILYTNLGLILITATIISFSYTTVTLDTQSSVQSIQGALSVLVTEIIFDNMYQVIYVFPAEMDIFIKEKGLYSPCPYFLSKLFSLIPYCGVLPLLFWLTYFIPLHFLKGFSLFINIYFVLFVTSICSTAFGLCLSALFPTVEYLNLVITPYETFCMMFSGIWVRVDSIPIFLRMFKYMSPFFIGFQSVSNIYWKNVEIISNCTVEKTFPCFENGIEVLKEYDLLESSTNTIIFNYLYLLALTTFYCCVGYIGIFRRRAVYTD